MPDASANDASADVLAKDSSSDGGVDAPTTWCTGQSHTFCGDFDRSQDVSAGFSASTLAAGGCKAELFKSDYKSGPAAARLNCKATGSGGGAYLTFETPALGKNHVHLEFDYKLVSDPFADGTQAIAYWAIRADGNFVDSVVAGANVGWFMAVPASADGGGGSFPLQGPPRDAWVHGVMDFVLGTTGSASITWDGVSAVDAPSLITAKTNAFTTVGFSLQLASIGATSPNVDLTIDNVIFDVK